MYMLKITYIQIYVSFMKNIDYIISYRIRARSARNFFGMLSASTFKYSENIEFEGGVNADPLDWVIGGTGKMGSAPPESTSFAHKAYMPKIFVHQILLHI